MSCKIVNLLFLGDILQIHLRFQDGSLPIALNSGWSSTNPKEHGNHGSWKDTSLAPQTARSRTLPEPKLIKAKNILRYVCRSALPAMPELSTRAKSVDCSQMLAPPESLGELKSSAQEPQGGLCSNIKSAQWAIC
jgi:hypothetical protein